MSAIRIAKGKAITIRILVGGLYPSKSTSKPNESIKVKKIEII
jgi:hypothetical protein